MRGVQNTTSGGGDWECRETGFLVCDVTVALIAPQGTHNLAEGERVNKGTKRINSLPLSPLFISFILRSLTLFYWENRCLQILRNTVALNSYLGFSALSKNIFFVCIKFNKGGNSLPKHFKRTANIHSNL